MTTPATQKLLTADEFFDLPDPEHGGKVELVEGKVVTMTPVGLEHGERSGNIFALLRGFVATHQLGAVAVETGYLVATDPDTLLAPDVSFVRAAQLAGKDRERYVPDAPDLAVEVKSPNDTEPEIARKVERYLRAGTGRVWVVRPRQRTVTVHRRDAPPQVRSIDDTLTSDDAGFEAEGFTLPLQRIFS